MKRFQNKVKVFVVLLYVDDGDATPLVYHESLSYSGACSLARSIATRGKGKAVVRRLDMEVGAIGALPAGGSIPHPVPVVVV